MEEYLIDDRGLRTMLIQSIKDENMEMVVFIKNIMEQRNALKAIVATETNDHYLDSTEWAEDMLSIAKKVVK